MKVIASILLALLALSLICYAAITHLADFPVQLVATLWLGLLLGGALTVAVLWHRKIDMPLKNLSCSLTMAKSHLQKKAEPFQEITDLETLEARLKPLLLNPPASESNGFMGEVIHEIKVPLNGIIGFISNLEDTPLNQQQQQFLKIIDSSAHSLLHIINQLLDYSKIHAGKLELETVAFDLRALAEDRTAIAAQLGKPKGLKTYLVYPPEQPSIVRGDPNRIRQVLDNLLTNAVKFTQAGEVSLEIDATAIDTNPNLVSVNFAVRDTGVGIPENVQHEIFEPYRQADASISRQFGGTGLGLCISASLVRLMGGILHVRSTQGRGSIFFFNLPMKMARAEEQVRLPGNYNITLPKHELQQKRALLVDDTPTNLFLLETICQNTGMPYRTASNGQEAVDLAVMHKFDLVFMDIQMPIMDGYTAIRKLRKLPNTENAHIVALTASAYPEDIERALNAGATEFIPKPFEKNQLLMSIADGLGIVPEKTPVESQERPESEVDEIIRHMHEFMRQQYQISLGEIKMTLAQTVMDWRPLLDNLRAYVKSGNQEQARQILHKLKGQLASIGLPEEAKTAALLNETLEGNSSTPQLMAQVDEFIRRLALIFKNLERDVTLT